MQLLETKNLHYAQYKVRAGLTCDRFSIILNVSNFIGVQHNQWHQQQ